MMITCLKCGTQDFYFKEIKGKFCAYCGKHIPKMPNVKLTFGKYRGRTVSSMKSKEEKQYLEWVLNNFQKIDKKLEIAIINQIG